VGQDIARVQAENKRVIFGRITAGFHEAYVAAGMLAGQADCSADIPVCGFGRLSSRQFHAETRDRNVP
jgi:hypothetical protein